MIAAALLFLVAIVGLIAAVGLLFFARQRRAGKRLGFVSLFVLVAAMSVATNVGEREAQAEGWASVADRREAAKAGFVEPTMWRAHREQIAAAENARVAAAQAAEAEAAAERRAAAEQRAAEEAAQRARVRAESAERQRQEADERARVRAEGAERRRREAEAEAEQTRLAAAARAAAAEEARLAERAACRADFTCWGRDRRIDAEVRCRRSIERQARYAHEWMDSWSEPMFSRFVWHDEAAGSMTYFGDRLRFQNGFGAWANVAYRCTYDTERDEVIEVRVLEGRL